MNQQEQSLVDYCWEEYKKAKRNGSGLEKLRKIAEHCNRLDEGIDKYFDHIQVRHIGPGPRRRI